MASLKVAKISAGDRQFNAKYIEKGFVHETAPPQIQYLAHQTSLPGLANLTTTCATVIYNAKGHLENTNLKLDYSDVVAQHQGQSACLALYGVDSNYFMQLNLAHASVPINPASLQAAPATGHLENVQFLAETRLPHQFFYSALLFSHQGVGHLYLTKHGVVYNDRSNMGEILQKMLKTQSHIKVQFSATVLADFIKAVLVSTETSQKILHRFLASSADSRHSTVDAVHFNYNAMYADFKTKNHLSADATAFPSFVEHLVQWIYLH